MSGQLVGRLAITLVVILTNPPQHTASARQPARIELVAEGEGETRHDVLGTMFVAAGPSGVVKAVVAVSPRASWLVRLRVTVALMRAYYRWVDGTGAAYAWIVRHPGTEQFVVSPATTT